MAKADLSAQRLRELLDYNPETGHFFWRVRMSSRAAAGAMAGTLGTRGYMQIRIEGHTLLSHRLAWLHTHGEWPAAMIDHINGDPLDNRIENLRDVSHKMNCENQRRTKTHPKRTSKYLGVSHTKLGARRWVAHICVRGKRTHIGSFHTEEEAAAAYIKAKREQHSGCTI